MSPEWAVFPASSAQAMRNYMGQPLQICRFYLCLIRAHSKLVAMARAVVKCALCKSTTLVLPQAFPAPLQRINGR